MNNNLFFREEFNLFWEFIKLPIGSDLNDFKSVEIMEQVTLPHDWLIYNVNDLYESSSGWYKKEFYLKPDSNALYFLNFDGIYMNSKVYINDQLVKVWENGYAAFEVDITDFLIMGNNTVIIQAENQSPNSRWYSGAGIYRDVFLVKRERNHIPENGVYISINRDKDLFRVEIDTELVIYDDFILRHQLYDSNSLVEEVSSIVRGNDSQLEMIVDPVTWNIEDPKLYRLVTTLLKNDVVYEQLEQKIGFKEIVFSNTDGLFLNGRHIKINGVCEHHDLGCLGAVFSRTVMRNRLLKLKEMGVNAIRSAHTIPAKSLVDLCDEMGFLLVNEAYDMWERPKTEFDYHRFFNKNLEQDVKSWIRRDRNSASLLMWSIGNEIYDTHVDEKGLEITKLLRDEVLKHDPKGNGVITIGSNFMPWENAQKCADILKFAGYNYSERVYEDHHKKYPDWFIYGSETASIVQSRGVYHFPLEASILVDDDKQCSSLGNSVTSWGAKSIEDVLTIDRNMKFSLGQFIWTGFDYIGEPTPYTTKNSYFGQIDTAGFEKDSYYVYKSAWNEEPMLHLYPYWNFNEGQIIDVRVATNLTLVKLYLNGELVGISEDLIPSFKVPFKKGVLKAEGYDSNGKLIITAEKRSFGVAEEIKITANKTTLEADGTDIVEVTVEVVDKDNNIVEDSKQPISVEISGAGKLLGLDSGDSTDYSQYKGNKKQLFQGKLKVFIGSTLESGIIKMKITSPGLSDKTITFNSIPVSLSGEREKALKLKYNIRSGELKQLSQDILQTIPVERVELITDYPSSIIENSEPIFIKAKVYPGDSTNKELQWKVTTDLGVNSNLAELDVRDDGCYIKALGDGHFRVKCMANNGKSHTDIISQLEFSVKGLGEAYKKPYSFISAGLYDNATGEIGAGNERGIATDNLDKTTVTFNNIDFGTFGSDTITLPIFDFESKPLTIDLYNGDPIDGELIDVLTYDKKTIWDVYQSETYKLPKRLKNIKTLSFVFNTRVHFKGFEFEKLKKGYELLSILECDSFYGDSFTRKEWGFANIGNNVSFLFDEMNIDKTVRSLEICGRSITEKNSIRIQTTFGDIITNQIVEFIGREDFSIQKFELEYIEKADSVEFIFLPGSQFDFKWFRFIK